MVLRLNFLNFPSTFSDARTSLFIRVWTERNPVPSVSRGFDLDPNRTPLQEKVRVMEWEENWDELAWMSDEEQ
jgi:hypothetical protein